MAESSQTERFEGGVPAALPLALLEAVRAHDTPDEILEDENLRKSLPRRLGLTDVVFTQIRRFEAAQRAGQPVRLDEVVPLMRLVLRRDDAAGIMEDAGRRFAIWHFERRPAHLRALYPRLPVRLSAIAATRGIRKAFKLMNAGTPVVISRKPLHVRIEQCLTMRIADNGSACPLVTGLIQEELRLYTGKPVTVTQWSCAQTSGSHCEWMAIPSADAP
jgi:predicted hydrocarbon binding protein